MHLDFIKKLLLESGEILRSGFGHVTQIDNKQDQSNIVTESDFKSEELIRKLISETHPDHNILGEEHGFEDKKSAYTWIVDPLDGTSNYAAQIPWFGVLVALVKNGQPIISGAYLPISNDLYLAQKGKGALKNNKRIAVASETNLKNILCCYSLDYSIDSTKTDREVQIIKNLVQNCRNLRSTNSCVDFCLVADGRIGAALNQTMKIWDIAAPQLIIEEAGGKVTDIEGKQIVYYPSEASLDQNFTAMAANLEVHGMTLQLIKDKQFLY
jgi:myo-inositol-1(or 4)-monophosphatase